VIMTLRSDIKSSVAESKKKPKASVDYSIGHAAEHCGICTYFERIEPRHCSKVKGIINRAYWCRLFEKK
jgi:hypothetical protein